jgi:hypothetical protein
VSDGSPYQSEREACAAARAVIPPEPGWSILSQSQLAELLHRALAEAGVETSDFEDRTGWWLSGWEDYTIAIIARWVTRAFETGKAAGPDGTVTEWGVTLEGYGNEPFASAADEDGARLIAASFPQSRTAVARREVGPWTPAPEEGS